jgi:dipeptidyl aminopeptidase/acylaminoacyl peptidase
LKKNLVLFTFLFSFAGVHAQNITGDWMGSISFFGKSYRVLFHLKQDSLKEISGTMDSPDQGVKGLKVDDVMMLDDELLIDMPKFHAQYSGKYNKDSLSFDGSLEQGGFKMPLKLKSRPVGLPFFNRPQTPKPPFPYSTEEVTIKNLKDSLTLAGTLSKPKGKGKFPAVIFITGSGPEDRDENIFEHKPFLILADELTKKGFAVLRCDDRGVEKSTGDYTTATTDNFASDVEAQIEFLKNRPDIDKKRIGLLGHSEGGVVAPLVASRRKDVAFVVMLAGVGIDMFDLMIEQDSLIMKADKESKSKIDESIRMNTKLYKILRTEKDSAAAADKMEKVIGGEFNYNDQIVKSTIDFLGSPWMRWYANYNPAVALRKVKCPLLAINGDKDLQVIAETNLPAIDKALKDGGNKRYEIKTLPGLNHLFQPCKKCTVGEYKDIEQTMDTSAIHAVSEWMVKNVH